MKKIILTLAATVTAVIMMSTAVFASGHHGGYVAQSVVVNSVPAVSEAVLTAAAVCEVTDCNIIGEHAHDDGIIVAHYYGDGHDNHGEYDHYYGDGHDYHEQNDHYYSDGHDNHNQYDHYYGDGHSYHTQGSHTYHAGEIHH